MMRRFLCCCIAILLGVTSIASTTAAAMAPVSGTITETLSLTFLTPSLGWRATDRWNPSTGARGPLSVSRTTDGGFHWRPLSVVAGTSRGTNESFNVYVSRILFADPHDGWLYGDRLFSTNDGGHTWQRLPVRGSETSLSVSGTSVWRLDSSCNATTNRCRFTLFASTTGTDTWRMMVWHPPGAVSVGWALARADRRHAWLTGGPYMAKSHMLLRLLGTTDGGRAWRPLPMPCSRNGAGSIYAQLVPYTATDLWIFCASEPSAGEQAKTVFRSSDGGHTWTMVSGSGGFGNDSHGLHNLTIAGYLSDAAVTTESDAWLALSRGALMHTMDGGRSWHPAIRYSLANPRDGGVGPVQFVDARHGWLLSFPDLLFSTTDGGRHWQTIRLSGLSDRPGEQGQYNEAWSLGRARCGQNRLW